MGESINTFTELNTDFHAVNTKPNVMSDAVNAALTTRGENQLILQNLKGNNEITGLDNDYQVLAVTTFKDIAYIVSAKYDDEGNFELGEIGTYPSPDWAGLFSSGVVDPNNYLPLVDRYQPIKNFSNSEIDEELDDDVNYRDSFTTPLLNFGTSLVEVEAQPSYDESVNLIITDDINPIRLINTRFKLDDSGKKAAIADRRQIKDTNTYSNKRFSSTGLIRQSDSIVKLNFDGVFSGGSHRGGGYVFFFRYVDSDGSLTNIIEESRLVSMSSNNHGTPSNESSGKLVKFTLTNLDKKFSNIKVYYSYASGTTDTTTAIHEITNVYAVKGDSITITIYGNEEFVLVERSYLNIDYSTIDTAKTMAQFDDRLLIANTSSTTENYDYFKEVTSKLYIEEDTKGLEIKDLGSGYADPDNVYKSLGYWDGETYQVGLVFILTGGRGLSPVMPLRGIDNYTGDATYTDSNEFLDSGFIGSDSAISDTENNLGVYRTSSSRTQLEDDGVTTNVKYFKVDISSLLGDEILEKSTGGFFFVRRERTKDCLVQGIITNTTAEAITPAYSIEDDFFSSNTAYSQWTDIQENITDIRLGGGKVIGDFEGSKFKILPAPGRITETNYHTGRVLKDAGDSITIHGKSNSIDIDVDEESGIKSLKNLSFYSADMLVNPPLFASLFNNTSKGIMKNQFPLVMKQEVSPGTEFILGDEPLEYWRRSLETGDPDTVIGGDDHYGIRAQGNVQYYVKDTSTNTTTISFVINITVLGKNKTTIEISDVPVEIIEDSAGNYTGGIKKTSNISGANIVNVGSLKHYKSVNPGDLLIEFENVQWQYQSGELSDDSYNIKTHYSDGDSEQIGDKKTIDKSVSIEGSPDANPITNLVASGYRFDPTKLKANDIATEESITRENLMIYVAKGQNGYANKDFASVSDRNLYYVSRDDQETTGDYKAWAPNGIISSYKDYSKSFCVTNTDYSDYVGVRLNESDILINSFLKDSEYAVYNFKNNPINTDGITGTDLGDYVYSVQDQGINFGLIANIYEDIDGAMDRPVWMSQNESTSFASGYKAVSKRFRWSDFEDEDSNKTIDIFDGDCYINYTYKRSSYGLGIPGVPTATDPDLYIDGNQDTGLYDKGFVFPIITQNNYNTALRTIDTIEETETLLYGKGRSFFPLEKIDVLRGSRQPESTGYNFGYNFNFSDRLYYILNSNSPTFNINYGNRIMVSSPSVSGSFSNGYTDFSGINFRDYNKHLGEITKLISHNNEVICVFESGLGIVPINQRTMISEDTGGVFLDDAEVLAQKMNVLSSEYGSSQQFSIVKTDTYVYGVDYSKNKIWRIIKTSATSTTSASNSVEVISDFAIQSALNAFKKTLENEEGKGFVKANYDRESNDVTFTFLNKDDNKYKSYEENNISSIVYNETLGKWVSKLSWNPLHIFNLANNMISINSLNNTNIMWDHYSSSVDHCNFYGEQEKFIFEFVLVDNPSVQKILDNMLVICNRAFPGRVTYGLLETDVDFETFSEVGNKEEVQLLRQRKEPIPSIDWDITIDTIGGISIMRLVEISKEDAERIVGAYIYYNDVWYIVGEVGGDSDNGFYHEILDQNRNSIAGGLPAGWTFDELHYGIIHQNMEYVEDHLYIEVGSNDSKPRVRDKAIRVRFMYEGYDYVTIQTIISSFTYSFN
jgi:hypothetical protein